MTSRRDDPPLFAVATANLNYGRDPESHAADIQELDARLAKMWVVQWVLLTVETVIGPAREAIWLRHVHALRKGSLLGSVDRLGFRIRLRRIRWRLLQVPEIGRVKVIVVHMPPRRYRPLYAVYAMRLRRLLAKSGAPWVVGGDWNVQLEDDPAELRKTFGGDWFGPRIDGFHVHPALVDYVHTEHAIDRPKRNDNHPFVILTFGPKKENR